MKTLKTVGVSSKEIDPRYSGLFYWIKGEGRADKVRKKLRRMLKNYRRQGRRALFHGVTGISNYYSFSELRVKLGREIDYDAKREVSRS